ncbi:MAG: NAD(P)/FAD-dependent oxidoreductase [Euryarchaeota archaeon]|nr:NAD(P)/FAD-dependent oxidoreductase [Euryarchaeota archaeon]MDE1881891.1 NAD(P)/FAD-dependent oxidoreductase [Euryarchaeota archaeon]MDE2044903.1 NAD(P)/FAD-dependent oxidoreductase [Thermoplasmata archaeon]
MGALEVDALVVGAGPAGSTAAFELARRGHSVLVVEEHRRVGHPVQCAGLVSQRVLDMVGTRKMVLHEVRGATVWSPSLRPLSFKAPETRAYVLSRSQLDFLLAEKAARAGARFETGTKFVGAERSELKSSSAVSAHLQGPEGEEREVRARLVIGADGVASHVARGFRLRRPIEILPAFEAEMPFPGGDPEQVEIYLGNHLSPGLFGWWVPDGHGNARVGVGVRSGTGKTAREYYEALGRQIERRYHRPLPAPVEIVVAGIPIGSVPRTSGDHVLLVGDAAAQVKPISGGGIFTGMRCAEIAAEAAHEALIANDLSAARLAAYDRAWRAELGEEFDKALYLRRLFLRLTDRELEKLLEVLSERELLGSLVAFGDIDFPTIAARKLLAQSPSLLRLFPKALAALLRRGGELAPELEPRSASLRLGRNAT